MEVVGEAADGWEAVHQATRLRPDVVLMDIAMPGLRGMEATEEIHERLPDVRVLALTMHDREEYFFAMLRVGASGYVLKEGAPEELLTAIRAVHSGEAYLSPAATRLILEDYLVRHGEGEGTSFDRLTLREKEILQLAAEGKTNREIAGLLSVSIKTVEKDRSSMMHKLGLRNLSDLIRYAIRKGLIE
jgi:two-component system response regulator NreC